MGNMGDIAVFLVSLSQAAASWRQMHALKG